MQQTSDKLVKRVLKFRKAEYDWDKYGNYYTVAGCSFINIANSLCERYNGYLVKFKETDFWRDYKCKLVIMIPKNKWMKFVYDWTDIFSNKITRVSWSRA